MKNMITIINLAILFGITSIFSRYDKVSNNKEGQDKPIAGVDEALVSDSENIGTMQSNVTLWPKQWDGNVKVSEKDEEADEALAQFLREITEAGTIEIELGKIAAQKATKRPLKDYGALVVKDQSAMLEELKLLAEQKNITIYAEAALQKAKDLDALTKVHGASFNRKYITMRIKDLRKEVKKIERATRSTDADLQVFATKYLPVLQSHLDRIKAIKKAH